MFILVLFYKQTTANEMRISDWSSDVCSSDLCWRRRDSCGGLHECQVELVHAVAELALEQPELVGDACARRAGVVVAREEVPGPALVATEQPVHDTLRTRQPTARPGGQDRKSTRLNSSH